MVDVNLQGCRKITSLEALSSLSRLAGLNLRNCDGLGDSALGPLSRLVSLRSLDLSGCTHLTGRGCASRHLADIHLDLDWNPRSEEGELLPEKHAKSHFLCNVEIRPCNDHEFLSLPLRQGITI